MYLNKFIFVLALIGLIATQTAAQIKVAVSGSFGREGILKALKKDAQLSVETLSEQQRWNYRKLLNRYDVIVVASTPQLGDANSAALRYYAESGGGVMLNHKACSAFFKGQTLFPEVFGARGQESLPELYKIPKLNHPVAAGLPVSYKYSYSDYLMLKVARRGVAVARNKRKRAVLIAGRSGDGWVVANGVAIGLGKGNKELEPTGAELKILHNAITWLARKPVTKLPTATLTKREKRVEAQIIKAQNLELERVKAAQTAWFADDYVRCGFLAQTPVAKLGGRFYLIARAFNLNFFDYARTRQSLHQLKLLGVTDIVQLTIRGNTIYHPTKVKHAVVKGEYTRNGYDPFMALMEATHKEKMGVWIKLQLTVVKTPKGQSWPYLYARDAVGKRYLYKKNKYIPDVLSKEYRKMLYDLIDDYAGKYNKHGNFKGFYYDMPYMNARDFHGDDMKLYAKYCQDKFGETPPTYVKEKVNKLAEFWADPNDKWWRRYVLFKQWVNDEFCRDIAAYVRKKGLEFAIQLHNGAANWKGWRWGHNPYVLSKLGKWTFTYPTEDEQEPLYALEGSTSGFFGKRPWGRSHTSSLRGHEAGLGFPFNMLFRPFYLGYHPRVVREVARNVRNIREWSGAKLATRVAFLHNDVFLMLRYGNAARELVFAELPLYRQLSHYLPADRIFTPAVETPGSYRLLIAQPNSVTGVSAKTMQDLENFIRAGGNVLNLNAKWSIGNADLTKEEDVSTKFTGKPYQAPAKKEKLSAPYVHQLGKGKVITLCGVNRGVASLATLSQIAKLAQQYAQPEIYIRNKKDSTKPVSVMTTLKKGNWVATTLYANEKAPTKCKLYIDMNKLGVRSSGFRVLLYGRELELFPPGCFRPGESGKSRWWTAKELKNGIDINIVSDNTNDQKLPAKIDVSHYGSMSKSISFQRNRLWNKAFDHQRNYEHEIVVIAPFDELDIKGNKI